MPMGWEKNIKIQIWLQSNVFKCVSNINWHQILLLYLLLTNVIIDNPITHLLGMQYEMAEKLFDNSKKILMSVLWKPSQTRSSDDFPHCRCCGWHHAPLVQAEFSNVYYVESIDVFFWGDSIAYGSLVDVLWQREMHSKYEFTIANLIQIHSASCGFII